MVRAHVGSVYPLGSLQPHPPLPKCIKAEKETFPRVVRSLRMIPRVLPASPFSVVSYMVGFRLDPGFALLFVSIGRRREGEGQRGLRAASPLLWQEGKQKRGDLCGSLPPWLSEAQGDFPVRPPICWSLGLPLSLSPHLCSRGELWSMVPEGQDSSMPTVGVVPA